MTEYTDITKVIVVCQYCGRANLFSYGVCQSCGATLKIECSVTDERLDELEEKERLLSLREQAIESDKEDLRKKEQHLKLMEHITKMFVDNRPKYAILTIGLGVLFFVSFAIVSYILGYVWSLPHPIITPVTPNENTSTNTIDIALAEITPLLIQFIPILIIFSVITAFIKSLSGKNGFFLELSYQMYATYYKPIAWFFSKIKEMIPLT